MNGCYILDSQTIRQSGFSLLEIVITLFIISIGILGLVIMQATGLNSNQRAYQRSQATILAYDMADRMRANTSAINNYLTSFMVPTSATRQVGCITTGVCSTADMAQNDLYEWNIALSTALPDSNGAITTNGAGLYTVIVRWDDDRSGTIDADDPNSQVSFQP